jgi:aminoglycoside phosphotransferase (APT) family kinase protein
MGGSIAGLYGSFLDEGGDSGVLLLEDVDPSTQGDVLAGCTEPQAESLLRTLARLHASSLDLASAAGDATLPRWHLRVIEEDVWARAFSLACERYPEILTIDLADRLSALPAAVLDAGAALADDATCWIHADMHLDNVVFRPDDSAVILDWANACVGPPAIDLAHLFSEGLNTGEPESRLETWLPIYAAETTRHGGIIDLHRLRSSIGWAILRLLQGSIGWAGSEEEPHPRFLTLRENLLRNTCAWLDTDVVPNVV